MKKLLTLLVLTTTLVQGQENPSISRTVFKLSPFHFTQNTLKVGIENFNPDFTKSISIYAGVRTSPNNNADIYYNEDGFDGVMGELQFKKYVSPLKEYTSRRNNTYVQGIYAGVFLQGGSFSGDRHFTEYNYDPNTGNSTMVEYSYNEEVWNGAIGFTLGAQRVFWNTLFVEVYIGGGLQIAESTITGPLPPNNNYYYYNNSLQPSYKGIIPKIGIQIGMGL
jgi:hypothetical protein